MALDRPDLRPAVAVVAAAGYAWWATGLRPFTWPSLVAVGAAGVVAFAVGSRRRDASGPCTRAVSGAWIWGVPLVLLAAWELAAYLQQPRADHPTLSSLADQALDGHPVRALAFLAWAAVAADLARR
jgi:hypothetical protein